MKKYIVVLLFIIFATLAFGKDCWMSANNTIAWDRPTTVYIDGIGFYSPNLSDEMLERGGYTLIENVPDVPQYQLFFDYENRAVYPIFSEETNKIVEIDQETLGVANQFYVIMTAYFGDGAVTNREITERYVLNFFASKVADFSITSVQLAHATLLERYFSILGESTYNPVPNTTWSFPFGKTNISVDYERRYYIKNGERIYLN